MKIVPTSKGPFTTRPYYTDEEIEEICSNALSEVDLLPTKPVKVRIDRFINLKFNVQISIDSLDKGVLGFTVFSSKGVEGIYVAKPADESSVEDRRINSTLAHEAGHALMHTQLFVEHFASNLFDNDPNVTQTRILCRDEQQGDRLKQHRYDGRWWEYQANSAIGALLMPKQAFLTFMRPYLERNGAVRISDLHAEVRAQATKAHASLFDVNPAVARRRINSARF